MRVWGWREATLSNDQQKPNNEKGNVSQARRYSTCWSEASRAPAMQAASDPLQGPVTTSSSCVSQPRTTVNFKHISHGLAQAPGSVPKHSEEIIPQSGIN